MMRASDRDIELPEPAPRTASVPELQIGFVLEDVFCAYVEWSGLIVLGHPEAEIARLRDMGGWTADELRGRGVDPALVDRLEELLAGVPGHGDFPRELDQRWVAERQRIGHWIEEFIGVARDAVGIRRGRYFDYGVMLSRIGLCTRMLRMAELPLGTDELRSVMRSRYQDELVRAVRVLVAFVVDTSAARPRDPELHELDHAVDALAEYATRWLATEPRSAEEFHRRCGEVLLVAGMRSSDAIARALRRYRYGEPLPEAARIPLAVPHYAEEFELLHNTWQAARVPKDEDMVAHQDVLRRLLEWSRHLLGPVHPVTLNIQIDFASAQAFAGNADIAVPMLVDIAETAMRYYGPAHPVRYMVVGNVHYCLRVWSPGAARELYDFPLKSLVLADEDVVSEPLRHPRTVIRESLGLDNPGG